MLYYIKPYKAPAEETDPTEEASKEIKLFDRPETPRRNIRLLCALWYSTYLVFENMFLKFAVTYMQYSPGRLSAPDAAEIYSVATSVFTAFSGINILITMKVRTINILYYSNAILIVGMVMLVFAHYSIILLWMSSVVLCAGFASMYASIYAYTGELMTFTDNLSTLFIVVRSALTLVTPVLIGLYIEQNSSVFIIIEGSFFVTSLLLFLVILYFVNKYNKNINKASN